MNNDINIFNLENKMEDDKDILKIINSIETIIQDYKHYKNKKNFINLIEFMSDNIMDEKDIICKILKNNIEELKRNKNIINIEKVKSKLEYFIISNEKEYISKNVNKDWTSYEYKDHYMLYINNKKIDLNKTLNEVFPNKKIISIQIDNNLRRNINKITIDDIKMSKNIKIKIER